ncbi:glycoprotein hormone alpha-2 [Bombina bombina]|uniref:glycoprotein hormone alpha-2 n=1 Tax=Bombina bombina TaxID=8345 RepID=UPI00235AEE0A|nr:glycoprotein hormone alpha-2 [Bombina bombina]
MDFIVDLPSSNNHNTILVVVDLLTKMAHFIPYKKLPTSAERAELFLNHVVRYITMILLSALCVLAAVMSETQSYEGGTPGCHLHPFNVTIRSDRRGTCRGTQLIHACVGHCESSAFPSKYSVLVASGFKHNITSVSQCCTISKMQKVKVRLHCGGSRREEIEIGTAKECQCDMCRLSRY